MTLAPHTENRDGPLSPSFQFARSAELALLVAAIVVALVLRLRNLNASYWADEIDTHNLAVGSWHELLTTHPNPFYYILARFALLIDDSEVMLRMPGLIASILSVLVIYTLAKRLAGTTAGLTAAWLLATSFSQILVTQEARFYALIVLLTLTTVYVLVEYIANRRMAGWIALPLLGALGIMTHTIFLAFYGAALAGFAIWVLVSQSHRESRSRLRALAGVTTCGLLAVSSLIPYAAPLYTLLREGAPYADAWSKSYGERAKPDASSPAPVATAPRPPKYRMTLPEYLDLYRTLYFAYGNRALEIVPWALFVFGFAHLAVRRPSAFAVLCSVTFLVPLVIQFIEVAHRYSPRYFVFQGALAVLVIAVGVDAVRRLTGLAVKYFVSDSPSRFPAMAQGIVLTLVLAPLAYGTFSGLANLHDRPIGDWKGAARRMVCLFRPNDKLVFIDSLADGSNSNYREAALLYYLQRYSASGTDSLSGLEYFTATTTEDVVSILKQHPSNTVWVISRLSAALPETMRARLDLAVGPLRLFVGAGLRVAGEPTVNLIQGGDFETPPDATPPWDFREDAQRVQAPEALDGQYSAKFVGSPKSNSAVIFSVLRDPELATESGDTLSLVPKKSYTLSFDWKFQDIVPHSGSRQSSIRVVVSGRDSETQKYFFLLLAAIHGDIFRTMDWHHCAYTIATGNEIPERCDNVRIMLSISDASGTLWLDNVQFEPKDHATPFVNGTRLPHDQRLAAAGLD